MRTLLFILALFVLLDGCKSSSQGVASPKMKGGKHRTYKARMGHGRPPADNGDGGGVIDYVEVDSVTSSGGGIYEDHREVVIEEAEIRYEEVKYTEYVPLKAVNADIKDKSKPLDSIKGLIAYTVPDEMTVGKSYTIKIRISKEKDKKVLIVGDNEIPINDTTVHSTITIESIRVEPVMSANIFSADGAFEITSLSSEVQDLEAQGFTEWAWGLIPKKAGAHQLKLIVKVRIVNEQGGFFKDIVVFDRPIKTKANLPYTVKIWFNENWKWLWTAIIVPIFLWWRKKRKEKEDKDKPSNSE